eukprot:scaffold172_cov341-Pavlova_lutheri.AAC.33
MVGTDPSEMVGTDPRRDRRDGRDRPIRDGRDRKGIERGSKGSDVWVCRMGTTLDLFPTVHHTTWDACDGHVPWHLPRPLGRRPGRKGRYETRTRPRRCIPSVQKSTWVPSRRIEAVERMEAQHVARAWWFAAPPPRQTRCACGCRITWPSASPPHAWTAIDWPMPCARDWKNRRTCRTCEARPSKRVLRSCKQQHARCIDA